MRGIGVALIASTSTLVRSALEVLLVLDAEALLLVDDDQPEVLEAHVRRCSSRWVPITTSTVPSASPARTALASASVWNRDSPLTVTGKFAYRSENVSRCCWTSSVVGTSTATCLPSCTALNAARTAISVLP